jgi:hypothetical protein
MFVYSILYIYITYIYIPTVYLALRTKGSHESPQIMATAFAPGQGLPMNTMSADDGSYSAFTARTIGKNHVMAGILIATLVTLIILMMFVFMYYCYKYKECMAACDKLKAAKDKAAKAALVKEEADKENMTNLNTGGNNPQWHNQMGDAGWGGTLHSSYQMGQPRVWSASAEGPHEMTTAPNHATRDPNMACPSDASRTANNEALALAAAGGLDLEGTAKVMSDDELIKVMNGG